MNLPPLSPGHNQAAAGCSFCRKFVDQQPVYDRKLKVHRPRKKRGKGSQPKFV